MGGRLTHCAAHLALRLRVLLSHWSLDAMLAAGVDPDGDPALVLRAAQLHSPRHRRRLASWVERLVRDTGPDNPASLSARVPTAREQVDEARDSLLLVARLLREEEEIRSRGIAMVQRLLTDGGSVLYTETSRGAVELQLHRALDCLVGSPNDANLASRLQP